MAKKTPRAAEAAAQPEPAELSGKLKRTLDAIKRSFVVFVKDYNLMEVKREELAPKFMDAFYGWAAEHEAGSDKSFVGFVRYLVPDIGFGRAYREHRAYQAADYLRRLVNRGTRRGPNVNGGTREVGPATATDAFARLLASFLPMVPEPQRDKLWAAVHQELGWTERRIDRLQTQVEHVSPLVEVKRVSTERMVLTVPERGETTPAVAAAA